MRDLVPQASLAEFSPVEVSTLEALFREGFLELLRANSGHAHGYHYEDHVPKKSTPRRHWVPRVSPTLSGRRTNTATHLPSYSLRSETHRAAPIRTGAESILQPGATCPATPYASKVPATAELNYSAGSSLLLTFWLRSLGRSDVLGKSLFFIRKEAAPTSFPFGDSIAIGVPEWQKSISVQVPETKAYCTFKSFRR